MRIYITLIICLLNFFGLAAQEYKPTWESIDSRPVPDWVGGAKFGIFIHWGPYSVPSWSPKGTYSEWYQYWIQGKSLFGNGNFQGDEVYQYHIKTYGENFPYYNFGKMFTADLFSPEKWAELFEKAGAKYIVLTSKHHDGYTLWSSKEANDRGFPWNSVEVGSKRDLVGELSTAIKKTDIKMGLYYSLYEWYHPWWINDRVRFVKEHYLPQVKDLVQTYKPDLLWVDGEWDMEAEKWKSTEFLAWLFNESKVKNTIAINDRWGKGIRKKHGGYFTTEYESGSDIYQKTWEECRGIGFSFGYNRNEDAKDYNSPQALILMLVNIVSAGGNLLLDIGPDERGRIPVIMEERLLQMGRWLDLNGEAIYNTTPWNNSFQWSETGSQVFKSKDRYLGGDFILKQTINPKEGQAIKELFFTQNKEAYFVIAPKWYENDIIIKNIEISKNSKVIFLATGETLKWKKSGNNIVIKTSKISVANFLEEYRYSYVFKITKK